MSLRVRLVLLILVVVALAAVALSAVELETLVNLLTFDAIERSRLTGQQVSALLLDHIERYSENYPVPQSLEETKALWNDIVSDDEQFHRLLLQMMASSSSLLEINVAGENGVILASLPGQQAIGEPVAVLGSHQVTGADHPGQRHPQRRLLDVEIGRESYQFAGGGPGRMGAEQHTEHH